MNSGVLNRISSSALTGLLLVARDRDLIRAESIMADAAKLSSTGEVRRVTLSAPDSASARTRASFAAAAPLVHFVVVS